MEDPMRAFGLIVACILTAWLATLVPWNRPGYRAVFMAIVLVALLVVLVTALFFPGWL